MPNDSKSFSEIHAILRNTGLSAMNLAYEIAS